MTGCPVVGYPAKSVSVTTLIVRKYKSWRGLWRYHTHRLPRGEGRVFGRMVTIQSSILIHSWRLDLVPILASISAALLGLAAAVQHLAASGRLPSCADLKAHPPSRSWMTGSSSGSLNGAFTLRPMYISSKNAELTRHWSMVA